MTRVVQPCRIVSADSSWRDVTTTQHPGSAGRSGRTCSASSALSSTRRIRRPDRTVRSRAARSSRSSGIEGPSAPRLRRKAPSTPRGERGSPGEWPRRSTYSWPSGKASATWWAHRSARAVLPTPADPESRSRGSVPLSRAASQARSRAASSSVRPMIPAGSAGSSCGVADPPLGPSVPLSEWGVRRSRMASRAVANRARSAQGTPSSWSSASRTSLGGRVVPAR